MAEKQSRITFLLTALQASRIKLAALGDTMAKVRGRGAGRRTALETARI